MAGKTGMTLGVWLNLWTPLYPLLPPGYQRSTAEERQEETGVSGKIVVK